MKSLPAGDQVLAGGYSPTAEDVSGSFPSEPVSLPDSWVISDANNSGQTQGVMVYAVCVSP